jgi:hypothetical protein
VPGYQPPQDGPGKEAELRACTGLVGLVAAATVYRDEMRDLITSLGLT